jgi:hypothetical protein
MVEDVKKLEAVIENAAVKWAARNHIPQVKLNVWGRRGLPDRLFFFPGGNVILIEFKRPDEKPRRLQVWYHKKLAKVGHVVQTFDNEKLCIEYLEATLVSTKGLRVHGAAYRRRVVPATERG